MQLSCPVSSIRKSCLRDSSDLQTHRSLGIKPHPPVKISIKIMVKIKAIKESKTLLNK
jgi:hypothetical protein